MAKARHGTRWLHLSVPRAAVREVVAKIKRATDYPQAPEYDVFVNVNAVARGWMNYYRIWHKTPRRLSLASVAARTVQDKQAYINTDWAKGRSQHKRLETRAKAADTCQHCGAMGVPLLAHHPNRLSKAKRVKKGAGPVARSGMMQQTKLLCHTCHLAHHHHNTRQ